MKKAAAAGALLALMLAVSLWNIRDLDRAVREMKDSMALCRSACEAEDWDGAEKALARAAGIWEERQGYAHVFLRQTETDAVEDALRDVLECLRGADPEGAEVALLWLDRRLSAMAEMEHITWEAVF